MLGTIVNTLAVIGGGIIGLLLKKGLSEKFSDGVMTALGLCTFYIGIKGVFQEAQTLIVIVSMVVGTLIGEGLDLQGHMDQLGIWIEKKFKRPNQHSIAEGFTSACLLFCVGAMTIVGSLQSGISGNHEMLFTKSMLDFVAAIIFASTLGVGVLFSSVFLFIYQGFITVSAQSIAPFLTTMVVANMNCVGSIIIIGLAFNMLKITKLRIINFVSAIFLPILFMVFL